MNSFGIPEFVIVVVIVIGWLIPLAAAGWALLTLHRLAVGQQDLRRRMETLERLLKSGSAGPASGL